MKMKTVFDFKEKKQLQEKISMVTCYDHWSARLIAESSIDCVLVGDSLAMVMHGHSTTLPADVELMALHTAAVARGLGDKFLISDLPFLSYRKSLSQAVEAVERLMKAGAHAVKLEGADGNEDLIAHLHQSGVPVMGHIGLTPQSIHQLGGYKVQGREDEQARALLRQAKHLEQAGCFALVLECLPQDLAQTITLELSIPTIGIGAGPHTDGQVLVLHDLLGLNSGFKPKFLRQYLTGQDLVLKALNHYHQDVLSQDFPGPAESYS